MYGSGLELVHVDHQQSCPYAFFPIVGLSSLSMIVKAMLPAVLLVLLSSFGVSASRTLKASCAFGSVCPAGYQRVPLVFGEGTTAPCPFCTRPASLNCGSVVGQPLCCGGTTGKNCPTISCTYSSSYAISGSSPTGEWPI